MTVISQSPLPCWLTGINLEIAHKLIKANFVFLSSSEEWEVCDHKEIGDWLIGFCPWGEHIVAGCDTAIFTKAVDTAIALADENQLDEVEELIRQAIAIHQIPTIGDQICLL